MIGSCLRIALAATLAALITLPTQAASLSAVASFTILADMVREVGGDRVRVTSLVGPNGDPHAYEPTPKDAQSVKSADLMVVNGLGLEGWMDRLVAASGFKGRLVVASDGIPTRHMTEEGKEIVDPHGWNDAANGIVYVGNIVNALAAADPANAALYESNGKHYQHELRQLDAYARQSIATIDAAKRKVLTSHDALGYFGDAYGVTMLAPVGFSMEAEASAKTVAALIEQIKREVVKSYFIENSSDPRLVEQIARATGARSGGVLYVEALSAADGPAPTYFTMIWHNLDLIIDAMRRN